MLLSLHIENVAIIDVSDIDFSDGFNVLTGETGAGKSIIIDSINLLLGNKGSKDIISSGKEYAFVSAVFSDFNSSQISFFEDKDIYPDDDGNVVVSRRIGKDGRNISKINGQNVTVSLLKTISPVLVGIFGQHDGSKILDPSSHIDYLDAYCKNDDLISEYRNIYNNVKIIRSKIEKLNNIKDSKEQLEFTLKFQIDEIEKADIKVGEEERLKIAKASAEHKALISEALYNSDELLSGESSGIVSSIFSLYDELKKIEGMVDGISPLLEEIDGVKAILQDVSSFVSGKMSDFDEDGFSPDYIEERLFTINKIIKKYGSEQGAIDALEDYKEQLAKINDNDHEIEMVMEEYNRVYHNLEEAAEKISLSRKKGSELLCKEIAEQLSELDMPQVRFLVDVRHNTNARGGTKFTPLGYDCVEFLISANAGQLPKPLSKIASGGELSRIMLCLKSSLSGKENECDTFIYDEVDTGVSGATAQKIGVKLKRSATDKQVFCVTHLAQIAALADNHYKVEKTTEDNRTKSSVRLLDYNDRINEIARIMGGVQVTEQLHKSAKELIDNSSK